ncbi:hypothetical protein RYD26_10175 [Pasteurellaceae bacterium LIM206]|nr:hypothetical protein [Pasteurellaceae bacterium LIM206]
MSELYTEQQLIDKAILYVLDNMPKRIRQLNGERVGVKQYSNLEEFKRLNPNCCKLTKSADEGARNDSAYGYVRIEYLLHYLQDIPADKERIYIEYDSCGEVQEFRFP